MAITGNNGAIQLCKCGGIWSRQWLQKPLCLQHTCAAPTRAGLGSCCVWQQGVHNWDMQPGMSSIDWDLFFFSLIARSVTVYSTTAVQAPLTMAHCISLWFSSFCVGFYKVFTFFIGVLLENSE